jgi:hypothetical protein
MEPLIVTPLMAVRWIMRQANHHHAGQPEAIKRFANMMRGGYWMCDGSDPIKFDSRGTLFDGRCRLAAVVLVQMPVQLHVVGWHFGVPGDQDPAIA